MVHCRSKSMGWVFATRMIGVICLLIAIVLANILTHYVTSPVFTSMVSFVNQNFWLLILIAVVLMAGAVFGAFPFPFNLPAPIITAFGSVFCIMFILKVFQWIDTIAATTLSPLFAFLSPIIATLVFLIVLASGYFEILRQLWHQTRIDSSADGQIVHETSLSKQASDSSEVTDAKSWEEIAAEFRLMLYDIIHRFRQEIRRKEY
jgi:hypothetical protein